ncbi:XRE family transcriptional regulator [Streptomyces sp. NPDC048290]|uniref:RICIN domain-containing protein n=1 Tax=Streptomyces sp. NPDC048290 TaxID=3155811 RepID=UPI0034485FB9
MGNLGRLSPDETEDTAALLTLMRQLKLRSGLTYRELEEKAARNGDVLARSTLADVLSRSTLPRPDLLAAFVRACGEEERVGLWLEARERIAADAVFTPEPAPGPGQAPAPAGSPATATETATATPAAHTGRSGAKQTLWIAVALAAVAALAVWGLSLDGDDGAAAPSALPDGWVTIHPVRTPDLCLTDGRDREGAYGSAVTVQLPCAHATVPRTYLEPMGEGLYRIQWHHPQEGKGCLAVMGADQLKGMLEPRVNCAQGTLFRFESATASGTPGFRLRPSTSSRCIGLVEDDTAEGAEAIEERCTGGADQVFQVRAG